MKRPHLVASLLLLTAATLRAEPTLVTSTDDGLPLAFSTGGLSDIRVDGRAVPLPRRAEFFSLRDAGTAAFTPVDTEAQGTADHTIRFSDIKHPLGLRLDATLTPTGPFLTLDGTLS